MPTQKQLQESAIRKIHKVLIREAGKPREGTYAYGTMDTPDGKISGEVRFNGMWNKFQVSVDGAIYGEYKNVSDAIEDLKADGFKNVEVFETPLTYQQLKLRRKKDGVV